MHRLLQWTAREGHRELERYFPLPSRREIGTLRRFVAVSSWGFGVEVREASALQETDLLLEEHGTGMTRPWRPWSFTIATAQRCSGFRGYELNGGYGGVSLSGETLRARGLQSARLPTVQVLGVFEGKLASPRLVISHEYPARIGGSIDRTGVFGLQVTDRVC